MNRPVAAVLLAVLVFALLVRLQPGGPHAARAVDDLSQLAAAAIAAAGCGWRARRSAGWAAWSWWLLAAGTGSWAAGEAVWSYYELASSRETPFPSLADAGFLLFAVFAVAGLLSWPSVALQGGARWRALLDGLLVAVSLFIVSWVTALGTTLRAGGSGSVRFAVSLGYPVADLVLLTLTVVIVAHARAARRSGLGLLAGWVAGFLLIAAAAHRSSSGADVAGTGARVESTPQVLLPYLPAGIGLTVAVIGQFTSRDRVALTAATIVVAALLGRQLLAVLENRRLVRQVTDAQADLRHQAFHDPLTGLANRALFADRLRHGVALHQRDLRPLSLLYCDLDGFKSVNDTLGHDAGDEVLKAAAERLRAVTRAGDTVARLGGDEFALLLEDGGDAIAVAAHILRAFAQPASAGRHMVPLATSIGVAELGPRDHPVSPEEFRPAPTPPCTKPNAAARTPPSPGQVTRTRSSRQLTRSYAAGSRRENKTLTEFPGRRSAPCPGAETGTALAPDCSTRPRPSPVTVYCPPCRPRRWCARTALWPTAAWPQAPDRASCRAVEPCTSWRYGAFRASGGKRARRVPTGAARLRGFAWPACCRVSSRVSSDRSSGSG